MNADARWNEDAELLAQLVTEGAGADDPRAGELLERRPEWRALIARAAVGAAEDGTQALSPAQAEADRRLVAECLAAARSPAPPARGGSATTDGARPAVELRRVEAPAPPRARRWPRILLALAATLALAWLARLWWASEQGPQRAPGTTLGGPLDSQLQGHVAPDLSSFAWEIKGDRSASGFCFSVWVETPAERAAAAVPQGADRHADRAPGIGARALAST